MPPKSKENQEEKAEIDEKTTETDNKDDKEKKEADSSDIEVPIKPKKIRRSTKFDPETLKDEEIGIPALYRHLKKFDLNMYPDQPVEALENLMAIYQKWMHKLYAADFYDTAVRITKIRGAKYMVEQFIYELDGGTPYVFEDDGEAPDVMYPSLHKKQKKPQEDFDPTKEPPPPPPAEEEPANPPPKPPNVDFLSDEDSDDANSQDIPEILDLFASQRQ